MTFIGLIVTTNCLLWSDVVPVILWIMVIPRNKILPLTAGEFENTIQEVRRLVKGKFFFSQKGVLENWYCVFADMQF